MQGAQVRSLKVLDLVAALPERIPPNHFLIAIEYGHGLLSPQGSANS
jgi:hypothetical protein